MRVVKAGHLYALKCLKSWKEVYLQFHQDGAIHGGETIDGPSTQEVIRVCIDRVRYLDSEIPWVGNADIIRHLQCAISGFEARAILRQTEKGQLKIEELPLGDNGHIITCK